MQSELIYNRDKAKQLLAFDGMQYGLCRPTDIDLSMDYKGNVFVFGELKEGRKMLTTGQKIHLRYLCDAIANGGTNVVAFLAHHTEKDSENDVRVADAVVYMYYTGDGTGKWKIIEEQRTSVDAFIQQTVKEKGAKK